MSSVEDLVLLLHDIGAFKFGEFTLKSGLTSPIYIDLRLIISFPHIMQLVVDLMWKKVGHLSFDLVCGVPYTALPIATAMSMKINKPMIIKRKEGAKGYGTKKAIEGVYHAGQRCLIIEDLVTSGLSVFESIAPIEAEGLGVQDVVVLVDREQGGRANIEARGKKLHALIKVTDTLRILFNAGRISQAQVDLVKTFVAHNQTKISVPPKGPPLDPLAALDRMTFTERAALTKNPASQKYLRLMDKKKSNLCVSADVTTKAELLALVKAVGPYVSMVKTHCDIIDDFDFDLVKQLQAMAEKYGFLIFEDRKFADIGNTVMHQFGDGVHKVASWCHVTNCHIVPGPGIIEGLKKVGKPFGCGLLLIAEMSSKGNLATGDYTQANIKLAKEHSDFVMGFITMRRLCAEPGLINMTPGVQLKTGTDGMGQQFKTPFSVIAEKGSDVIIVGRGIYKAADPAAAAKQYQQAAWDAYQHRLKSGSKL